MRAFKSALFWIYLWQLKAYHVGRFMDHFRTYKGRKALFNLFSILKVALLCLSFLFQNYFFYFFLLVFVLYIVELLLFVKNIIFGGIKTPIFTLKAIFLTLFSIVFIIFYLFLVKNYLEKASLQTFFTYLLVFDILSPIIISFIVLIFQPFFVMARNRILRKAKKKISQFLSAQAGKSLTVIAITGSYGKTSTKEFLAAILSQKFNVLATQEHKNSEIGIAQTILNNLTINHDVFIVEMGAYNKGGIKLLCDIVKPKIGIVTGVNEQHLATFGSMKNLLSAEGGRELLERLPKKGLLVVNGDNKYCLDLYKKSLRQGKLKTKIYTLKKDKVDSDIWTEDMAVEKDFVSFIVIVKERS